MIQLMLPLGGTAGSQRHDNAKASTCLDRNWVQRAEIAAVLTGTIVLVPLTLVGTAIGDRQRMGLGGRLGIAGLWLVTERPAQTAGARLVRLTGTILLLPGIMVASEFPRFEIRTGRDLSDALFTPFVCVLPMMVALRRHYLFWHLNLSRHFIAVPSVNAENCQCVNATFTHHRIGGAIFARHCIANFVKSSMPDHAVTGWRPREHRCS
jgi:hypothetical protein